MTLQDQGYTEKIIVASILIMDNCESFSSIYSNIELIWYMQISAAVY